jgi:hypothetical protein
MVWKEAPKSAHLLRLHRKGLDYKFRRDHVCFFSIPLFSILQEYMAVSCTNMSHYYYCPSPFVEHCRSLLSWRIIESLLTLVVPGESDRKK